MQPTPGKPRPTPGREDLVRVSRHGFKTPNTLKNKTMLLHCQNTIPLLQPHRRSLMAPRPATNNTLRSRSLMAPRPEYGHSSRSRKAPRQVHQGMPRSSSLTAPRPAT